jgi:hypothetical protein
MLKEKIGNTCAKKSEILAKTSNILNIKTVVTEQYPKGLGSTIDNVKNNLPETTKYFEKTSFNALCTDGILEELDKYKNIFVFGIETHICVYQTAMDLINNGYEVILVKDACKSRKDYEHNTGIDLMRQNGIKISCVEIVLFEFLKTNNGRRHNSGSGGDFCSPRAEDRELTKRARMFIM